MRGTVLVAAALALLLSGCAMGHQYMGIDLSEADASLADADAQGRAGMSGPVSSPAYRDMELAPLARLAQGGDKHAQLELGIRFEEGRGVGRDLKKARSLYKKAGSKSGGIVYIYNPSPGGSVPSGLQRLDHGPQIAGLEAARQRLAMLEQKLEREQAR